MNVTSSHVRSAGHASARWPEAELIRAMRTAVQLAMVIGGQVAVQHPRVEYLAAAAVLPPLLLDAPDARRQPLSGAGSAMQEL